MKKQTLNLFLIIVSVIIVGISNEVAAQKPTDKFNFFGRQDPDKSMLMVGYAGDLLSPVGVTVGSLKPRKIGWYATARFNGGIFNGIAGTIDKNGAFTETSPQDLDPVGVMRIVGKVREANVNFVAGINKRVWKPLWVYLGAGASYGFDYASYNYFIGGNREFQYDGTVQYTATKKWQPVFDAGLSLASFGFYISAGLRSDIEFKNCYLTFGVGFALN